MGSVIKVNFGNKSPLVSAASDAYPERYPSRASVVTAKVLMRLWFGTELVLFSLRPAIDGRPMIVACPWRGDKIDVHPALFGRLRWFWLTTLARKSIVAGGEHKTLSSWLKRFEENHSVTLKVVREPDSDMINYWEKTDGRQ